jgi:threonine dehydratase
MTIQTPLSCTNIEAARGRIDPVFLNSRTLSFAESGTDLIVKDETQNPIRSFKGRGTGWFVANLDNDKAPLVTASAGNFGQGLAYNAARDGRQLVVFASLHANPLKIEAMRRLGAKVVLDGEDFDAAKESARLHAARHDLMFVEDGASASIAEGAGTIAAELTENNPDIDAIFVPLGNGALAAGIGCWFKSRSPRTKVVAVAARGAPCMELSWKAGEAISTEEARTIADGIAVRTPVPAAVQWLQDTIDDVVLVEDGQILAAMRFAYQNWGQLVEPAGAAGLAGILAGRTELRGCRVATVLCGANLTSEQIRNWLPAATKEI